VTGRWWALLLALCASALLVSCGENNRDGEPDAAARSDAARTTYRLSTDWFFGPAFAPILLADQKGYFSNGGLKVSVLQGNPGGGSMQALAKGKIDFLYGALDELPFATAKGLGVKAVAVFTHSNVNSIVVRADSGIKGIEDLAGKTVGEPTGGGVNYAMFPDVLRKAGVDPDQVKSVAADYPTLAPGLLSGTFDAINVYYTTTPLLEKKADLRFFPYKDLGFGYLGGYGLMVRKAMLEKSPEDVEAVAAALLRAWADTARDPAATIAVAADGRFGESFLERDALTEYMKLELRNLQTTATKTRGLGYSTDAEWRSLIDASEQYGGLKQAFPPDRYYTNDFLPKKPILP
jgi:NitT/TauT family transport system substrate-binding protein